MDIPYFVQKKIGNHYLLLMAEGGSDYNHAVTALTAKSLWGPYVPCTINPVLTHRHLGKDYPVQSLGHADLVQTPTGDWYAVFLGTVPLFPLMSSFPEDPLLSLPVKGRKCDKRSGVAVLRPYRSWLPQALRGLRRC